MALVWSLVGAGAAVARDRRRRAARGRVWATCIFFLGEIRKGGKQGQEVRRGV